MEPKLRDLLKGRCPECGSWDLEWHCSQDTQSGVADGRLGLNEVTTLFYLGCEYCSETIRTVTGDDLAFMMTGAMERP